MVYFLGKDPAITHYHVLRPSSSVEILKLAGTAVNTRSF